MAKRKRYSTAQATIQASLQIALKQAQAALHRNPSPDSHGERVPAPPRHGNLIGATDAN